MQAEKAAFEEADKKKEEEVPFSLYIGFILLIALFFFVSVFLLPESFFGSGVKGGN